MKNRPSGCRSASPSRLFTRTESAGSGGGSPKSSRPVRRLASAHSASPWSNHSRRLSRSPKALDAVANDPKFRDSKIGVCCISDIVSCDYPDSSDSDFGLIFSCCLFVSGMALGCPEHSATVKPEADINGRLPMLRMGPFHLFRFQLDLRSVSRKR